MSVYKADGNRYTEMEYAPCGRSGLKLPRVSLGLWQNFGSVNSYENARQMCFTAFDNGITHFDLANNYGPVPGSAESNFGRILAEDLHPYRDELVGVNSDFDLSKTNFGEYGEMNKAWTADDVKGFTKIYANPLKIYQYNQLKNGKNDIDL